jgi:hypothetical protein
METEKYSPELVNKYLNLLKKEYPEKDSHFLEVAVLQYLLLDCEKITEPIEHVSYLKAKELYKQKKILILFYLKDNINHIKMKIILKIKIFKYFLD